jgi:putative endonuclease
MMQLNKGNKQATGKIGEAMAAGYLQRQGYRLLYRNWRHGRSEIDLIACKGTTLHFIEVKTRRSLRYGWPEEHVKARKIVRMMVAVEAYLKKDAKNQPVQLDILSIVLQDQQPPLFYLIEDVFL